MGASAAALGFAAVGVVSCSGGSSVEAVKKDIIEAMEAEVCV
jgi:hypothetical protein